VSGSYDVIELFGEARIPIASDQPLFHALGLELAYRYSDYSTGVQTDTYKIGGDWAPTADFRVRGGYNRAVRAPNIVELFAPQAVGLSGTTDPCAGPSPEASEEDCTFTGVQPGQYGLIAANSANQYNGLLGGNPNLQPETADTVTAGFVFTPTFVSGLTLAVDWYNIKIADKIGGIGADTIINNCIATHDPSFCDLIVRAPGSGSLWLGPNGFIINTNLNAGETETSGVDVEGNYRVDLADWGMEGAGGLTLNFIGTYLDKYTVTPPGGAAQECAGVYGPSCSGAVSTFGGQPLPDWRHKLRVTWDAPWSGFSLSGTWRHINEVPLEDADTSVLVTDLLLDAKDYFDLSGTWDIRENVTFRAGVNNVFDEDPPLNGGSSCPSGPCNGNTWPGLYDAVGRYIFFGVSADF
jgi:outer membrane receptor protein involved in Fe transport